MLKELMNDLNESKSCFHAVELMKNKLKANGYQELLEQEKWNLNKGKGYYVVRNNSSIMAFYIGNELNDYHYQMIASHSDSPTFKLKRNSIIKRDNMMVLNTEGYGGMLCATWMDRMLSIAGRVMIKDENGAHMQLVDIDKDLVMIPSLAIHMNREANSGMNYNKQVDMLPLFSCEEEDFAAYLANYLKVSKEQIIAHDLYLYVRDKARIWGANDEFIAASRLDDLQCAYASLNALLQANKSQDMISLWACFDNEEVGSLSKQGASSTFLKDVLVRINLALGYQEEDLLCALSKSFLVSSDNAHAIHPNHMEKSDVNNKVKLNEGIVIKHNANQKYTTDAIGASVFESICAKVDVKVQHYANRSDMPGGSTLGNLAMQQASMHALDIGFAQLAMHSSYECAGCHDYEAMIKALIKYYESNIVFYNACDYVIK